MMSSMAQRVAARWLVGGYKSDKLETKKREAWAKKMRAKLTALAKKLDGLDPDDLTHFYPLAHQGESYGAPPIGYEFELNWGYKGEDGSTQLKVDVWFEEGGSKRYRVEATVHGKRLPVVERTARRLKVPDFFKGLQTYLKAHKDELITGESQVWHSTDPSGNQFFGLTKGLVDWRDSYADYFSLENDFAEGFYELEGFTKRVKSLEAERDVEDDALYEAADAEDRDVDPAAGDAVERKYRAKLEALDVEFKAAVAKLIEDNWSIDKRKLSDLLSPSDIAAIIDDLKNGGSAGL